MTNKQKIIFLGFIWLISLIAFLYCISGLPTIKFTVAMIAVLIMINIESRRLND